MEEQLQTICFISKGTFMGLLGTVNAEDIGFDSQDITQLGYINENWKIEFAEFNQEKAEKARYILVADEFHIEERYYPKMKFKLLIHSQTDRNRIVGTFDKKFEDKLSKVEFDYEKVGSSYDTIARKILQNNLTPKQ